MLKCYLYVSTLLIFTLNSEFYTSALYVHTLFCFVSALGKCLVEMCLNNPVMDGPCKRPDTKINNSFIHSYIYIYIYIIVYFIKFRVWPLYIYIYMTDDRLTFLSTVQSCSAGK